jgi:hypothetical protein
LHGLILGKLRLFCARLPIPGTRLPIPDICARGWYMRTRGRPLCRPVAEMLCQRYGAQTEAVIADGRASDSLRANIGDSLVELP